MDKYYGYDRPNMNEYSKNVIMNSQMSSEGKPIEIDGKSTIGIVRNDLNPMSEKEELRKLLVNDNENIGRGSYIKYDGDIYLVTSDVDKHDKVYKKCKIEKCNQVIRLSKDFEVWGIASGSSYGSKLFVTDGGVLSDGDSKIDFVVGVNEMTRKIKIDTRFILDGEEEGIYKIGEKKVIDSGKYVFVCQKDNYMKGLDDLENSIAYNGDKKPTGDMDYTIHGSDRIVINKEYTYDITPKDGVIEFSFDEDTISDSLAVIVSRTEYTVTVKALVSDTVITLNVIHNGVVSGTKNITTAKR